MKRKDHFNRNSPNLSTIEACSEIVIPIQKRWYKEKFDDFHVKDTFFVGFNEFHPYHTEILFANRRKTNFSGVMTTIDARCGKLLDFPIYARLHTNECIIEVMSDNDDFLIYRNNVGIGKISWVGGKEFVGAQNESFQIYLGDKLISNRIELDKINGFSEYYGDKITVNTNIGNHYIIKPLHLSPGQNSFKVILNILTLTFFADTLVPIKDKVICRCSNDVQKNDDTEKVDCLIFIFSIYLRLLFFRHKYISNAC